MRTLFMATVFLFSAASLPAQSPLARKAFDEATALANAGDFAKALKSYKSAHVASGDDAGEFSVKLRYNLGVCYYHTGDLRSAAREFDSAIRLSRGTSQRAYYALGMTESALEDWAAARSAFLKAIELDPKNGEAWFDLAFVYMALHDYDQAAASFRRSIENNSKDASMGHNNLGVIMAMKNDLEAAENEFNAALDGSGGKLVQARYNLEFCRSLRSGRRPLVAGVDLHLTPRRPLI